MNTESMTQEELIKELEQTREDLQEVIATRNRLQAVITGIRLKVGQITPDGPLTRSEQETILDKVGIDNILRYAKALGYTILT